MDPLTPTEPPPPAYSEDRQEFDSKISEALQRSLHIVPSSADEDVWEEWDDAKFEAAARAHEQGAQVPQRSSEKERLAREYAEQSSRIGQPSSSTVGPSHARTGSLSRPLPASPPANTTTKERPSWFAEAQLDAPPQPPVQQQLPPPDDDQDDRHDEPVPPFAAVGPSLEGPPYEELVRVQPGVNGPGDSPPLSPLDSVDDSESPPPLHRSPPIVDPPRSTPRRGYVPNHVPLTPTPSVPHRDRTRTVTTVSSPPPPISFDPAIAYAGSPLFRSKEEPVGSLNASTLYNSAVSPFLVDTSHAQPPKKTNVRRIVSPAASGYASGVAEPFAPQTPDPYAPALPPRDPVHSSPLRDPANFSPPRDPAQFSPPGTVYGTYPPQQPPFPSQQQAYYPQQQPYPEQQQQQPSFHGYVAPTSGLGTSSGQWEPYQNSWGSGTSGY